MTTTTVKARQLIHRASATIVVLALIALALVAGAATGWAAPTPTTSPPAPCTVTAVADDTAEIADGVKVTVSAGCTTPQLVSVVEWHATSRSGNPLTDQVRWAVTWDGPINPGTTIDSSWGIHLVPDDCFLQVDVAYGHAPADLSTPYGTNLIRAWHSGDLNCTAEPTPAPTPSSTTPAPQPFSSSTPAPSASVTAVVPPAPPPPGPHPPPTAPVTTPAPAPSTTRPPTPKPTHHKPKPTPTRTHTPAVTTTADVGASGCICTPPPTAAPKTLPFTGFDYTAALTAAALLILAGAMALAALRYHGRKTGH